MHGQHHKHAWKLRAMCWIHVFSLDGPVLWQRVCCFSARIRLTSHATACPPQGAPGSTAAASVDVTASMDFGSSLVIDFDNQADPDVTVGSLSRSCALHWRMSPCIVPRFHADHPLCRPAMHRAHMSPAFEPIAMQEGMQRKDRVLTPCMSSGGDYNRPRPAQFAAAPDGRAQQPGPQCRQRVHILVRGRHRL